MESKKLKPISHYKFHKAIALALIHPEQYWPDQMKTSTQDNNISVGDVTCIVASKRSCDGTMNSSTPSFKKMRSTGLTNKTLCPCTGSFRPRRFLTRTKGISGSWRCTFWVVCSHLPLPNSHCGPGSLASRIRL